MESDAQKVCSNFDKVKEMMPEMIKLRGIVFLSSPTSPSSKEKAYELKLDSIHNEMEVMEKQIEEILSKYDEEEFKKHLLENCENAEKMMESLKEWKTAGW